MPLVLKICVSSIAFGIFTVWDKAKTFAGDVGSIGIALFLDYFTINYGCHRTKVGYILFFSVYGIDDVVTIISRIIKKQDIFQKRGSRLYQHLANEMEYY